MDIRIIDADLVRQILPEVTPDAHKGTQGHAVVVAGSKGKIGAACLAAGALLKTGCGLSTAYIPECGYNIIQTVHPEVMAITNGVDHIVKIDIPFSAEFLGIGPGLGQHAETSNALAEFLKKSSKPIVIDADAINIIASNKILLDHLPSKSILTPHPKELERLSGISTDDPARIEKARDFAQKHNIILVLKGAPTFITDGGQIFRNTSGNSALATAGSGDVLTGMITGFGAQGLNPMEAAITAVFLHGLTADIYVQSKSGRSFTASDIPSFLGDALRMIDR